MGNTDQPLLAMVKYYNLICVHFNSLLGLLKMMYVFFTDYSATLSEAGDITLKYTALRNVLKELASDSIRMFIAT